ncbi:MAG: GWxTD domain-containing protein, partial [Gemmatimonadetes bacterium]|nr:GWxTD domain-containing protein [Gemmatimonadota bacterium]
MPEPLRRWAVRSLGPAALLLTILPASSPAQFVDEYFEPAPAVPDSGTYAPEAQSAIVEGYRQLALVADPSDDEHLEAAKAAFERALDFEPRAAHAWNGKGIYELTKDEQWLVLLESLKKLFNRDHISMSQKAFQRALATDPEFLPARYNLALAYRQARGSENYARAIVELTKVVESDPAFGDAALLLAITYRDLGDLEAMRSALVELPETEAFPAAARKLMLAYALVNAGQVEDGTRAYWEGVDAIATPRDAELYWHDIRPIVSPETDDEFRTLPLAERPGYIRSYWQTLADASFVPVDERVAEHYRRLHHVYRSFRLELPERRHYGATEAYVPPWQTGFDDRGIIYLRHGPPDDVANYSGPEVEQNVSWKYERADGDPLIFHFMAGEDVGDFKLVRRLRDLVIDDSRKMSAHTTLDRRAGAARVIAGASAGVDRDDRRILAGQLRDLQDLYSSRGHLSPLYDRAATGLDPLVLQDEEGEVADDVILGTRTVSYAPDPVGDPLLYPVYAVPFKEPNGGASVAFYYALPTTQVTILPRQGGGSEVDYRYQLIVSDADETETAARQEQDVRIATPGQIPRQSGAMLPGVRNVGIAPGSYQYGLKLTDLNSGRSGVTQGTVAVDDFAARDLAMSGVVLAHNVGPASGPGPFVRWSRVKVLPLPSRVFRREQPVFVYYEVYGLDAETDGAARYRTTYTLEARSPDRNVVARFFSAVGDLLGGGEERGSVTYSFDRTDPAASDPLLEYVSLDVSDSPAGEYLLTVTLEDTVGGDTVRRSGLTLAGNRRARRALVEAAWTYRYPARVSETLRARLEGLPKAIRDIAWKA